MSWPDSSLREQYDTYARTVNDRRLDQQAATNEAEIRSRQSRQRAVPSQSVANDLAARLGAGEAETKTTIAKGRSRISQDAGQLSENYKGSVRIGKVSPNHGGNQAVWDTVGANANQPDLGITPKVEPIGEWHFDKYGVPVAGPKSTPPGTDGKPISSSADESAGRSTTGKRDTNKP